MSDGAEQDITDAIANGSRSENVRDNATKGSHGTANISESVIANAKRRHFPRGNCALGEPNSIFDSSTQCCQFGGAYNLCTSKAARARWQHAGTVPSVGGSGRRQVPTVNAHYVSYDCSKGSQRDRANNGNGESRIQQRNQRRYYSA